MESAAIQAFDTADRFDIVVEAPLEKRGVWIAVTSHYGQTRAENQSWAEGSFHVRVSGVEKMTNERFPRSVFLQKPFQKKSLVETVHHLVGAPELRSQLLIEYGANVAQVVCVIQN